jgi:hypothetical protein
MCIRDRSGWVAVTDGSRLAAALQALENAGLGVERVVSAAQPSLASRGHFHVGGGLDTASVTGQEQAWLTLSRSDGVVHLRLDGGLARARMPNDTSASVRYDT